MAGNQLMQVYQWQFIQVFLGIWHLGVWHWGFSQFGLLVLTYKDGTKRVVMGNNHQIHDLLSTLGRDCQKCRYRFTVHSSKSCQITKFIVLSQYRLQDARNHFLSHIVATIKIQTCKAGDDFMSHELQSRLHSFSYYKTL